MATTCRSGRPTSSSGDAVEVWHNQPNDRMFTNFANLRLAGDHLIVPFNVGGGAWWRARRAEPGAPAGSGRRVGALLLDQPGDNERTAGPADDDRRLDRRPDLGRDLAGRPKTLYYCTNAKDIERRHIWAVPVSGGPPQQVTAGEGIETYPAPLASGGLLATLSADWRTPQSLGIWPIGSASGPAPAQAQKIIFPTSLKGFPRDAHVKPELVLTKAPDGLEIQNQLFLPKDIKPGRAPSGDRVRARRSGPRRCCSAITTCSSTTGPTASISGSPTRATSSSR